MKWPLNYQIRTLISASAASAQPPLQAVEIHLRPRRAGIYLLVADRIVTYVGQSKRILDRVADHYGSNKIFDRVVVMEVEDPLLRRSLEAFFYRRFRPAWNKDANMGRLLDFHVAEEALPELVRNLHVPVDEDVGR